MAHTDAGRHKRQALLCQNQLRAAGCAISLSSPHSHSLPLPADFTCLVVRSFSCCRLPSATMVVTPIRKPKIVKKHVKKFKRHQSDRYLRVHVSRLSHHSYGDCEYECPIC